MMKRQFSHVQIDANMPNLGTNNSMQDQATWKPYAPYQDDLRLAACKKWLAAFRVFDLRF